MKKPVIKRSDCKFYINEEKRTVVCVLPDMCDKLIEFLCFNCESNEVSLALDPEIINMPNTFIGKAVCSLDDEWDEELGKSIAYARAREKFYNSFFRRANRVIQALDEYIGDMVDTFNDLGEQVTSWQYRLQEEIDKKIKGEA